MSQQEQAAPLGQERSEAIGAARFQAMLEETLLPPMHNVEFVRSAQNDYTLRFGATTAHIAELFQENSKLTPYSTLQVPADDRELNQARMWYFSTAYRMHEEDLVPGKEHNVRIKHGDLLEPLARTFAPFGQPGTCAELLYGIDLYVLYEDRLYRQVSGTDVLWFEKKITPFEHQMLQMSLLRVPRDTISRSVALAFLVGVPWRYMMFFGPRGYRRMLFECGRVMAQIEDQAQAHGLKTILCQDFYDARIDRVLLMDGVERSTLAIIAFQTKE